MTSHERFMSLYRGMRPHIIPKFGSWWCIGKGWLAEGTNPISAYHAWRLYSEDGQ